MPYRSQLKVSLQILLYIIHTHNRRDMTSTSPSISPKANDIMELRSIGQVFKPVPTILLKRSYLNILFSKPLYHVHFFCLDTSQNLNRTISFHTMHSHNRRDGSLPPVRFSVMFSSNIQHYSTLLLIHPSLINILSPQFHHFLFPAL